MLFRIFDNSDGERHSGVCGGPDVMSILVMSIFCLVDGYHLVTEDGMVGSLNMTLRGLVAVVFIGVRAREHL